MKSSVLLLVLVLMTASGFAACGGSSASPAPSDAGTTGDDGATADAEMPDAADETPPPIDHGKPSSTYPAFTPDMPELQNRGGAILSAPVIVPVTWDTDPDQTRLDTFTDQIGATDYWKAIATEYGVGVATVGAHAHMPASSIPASIDQITLDGFVADSAGVPATSGWPAPTAQTVYILYLHPSTVLMANGANACAQIGGYHTSTQVNGQQVAYAIVPRCNRGTRTFDQTTESASHELGEAVTDPHPLGGQAYYGYDNDHVAWSLFQQSNVENGDDCEFYQDSNYMEKAPFAFSVQRQWSNKSAKAGHNPCVPLMAGAYFNVTPTALETVNVNARIGLVQVTTSKGINIPVGTSKTFPVGFYSDAASPAWSIRAAEAFNPLLPATTHNLTVSVDRTSAQNGEIAYVTVTVNKAGSTIGRSTFAKLNFVTVLSSLNGTSHYMPILITN